MSALKSLFHIFVHTQMHNTLTSAGVAIKGPF